MQILIAIFCFRIFHGFSSSDVTVLTSAVPRGDDRAECPKMQRISARNAVFAAFRTLTFFPFRHKIGKHWQEPVIIEDEEIVYGKIFWN